MAHIFTDLHTLSEHLEQIHTDTRNELVKQINEHIQAPSHAVVYTVYTRVCGMSSLAPMLLCSCDERTHTLLDGIVRVCVYDVRQSLTSASEVFWIHIFHEVIWRLREALVAFSAHCARRLYNR